MMSSGEDSSQTIVFCFDALDFHYLNEFQDSLPNLTALRSAGVEQSLRSTFPPWTASAWPSMYTGVDPSEHGVYGFFTYDGYPNTGKIVTRTDVRAPALWNYLSERDVSSVVLNMPVTHPVDPIEGVLIPGYFAPENAPGHPEKIRAELDDALDKPYRIYSKHELANDKRQKLAGYLDLIEGRARAAEELLSTRDWSLAVVQVQKTDAVFHNFHDQDDFRQVYAAADNVIGTVLDAVDSQPNVILCSDHGIGPVQGYSVHVNELLREGGFVKPADEDTAPLMQDIKPTLIGNGPNRTEETARSEHVISRLVDLLRRVGVTPSDVYAGASRLGIESTLMDLLPKGVRRGAVKGVDWEASKAYCRLGSELGVRINLEGREPNGIVPAEQYKETQAELIRHLSASKTPDDEPVFEFVKPREDVYDGPYAEEACDVLFMPTAMNHLISTSLVGRKFVPVETFNHKRDGVFVAAGPAFDSAPESLALPDVAPIVMATLGQEIPQQMTGTVPEGLLSISSVRGTYEDVTYGIGADETDYTTDIENRLEDLGYLE
jgi:predicted AlkP superfamily phosphohydrolase/phosphomutase